MVERARVIFIHRASRADASTRARGRRGANGRARGWRLTVGWYFEPRHAQAKMLKCAGNDDAITMKADDAGDVVTFMFESPGA